MSETKAHCAEHSGVQQELKALGRTREDDRKAQREYREAMNRSIDEMKVDQHQTNIWLQKIVMEALTRWTPGSVKTIVLLSAAAGTLLAALVAAMIALSRMR